MRVTKPKQCWCTLRRYIYILVAIAFIPLGMVFLVRNKEFITRYTLREYQHINTTNLALIPEDEIQSLSESDMLMAEKRMERRRKILKEKCSALGLNVVGNDAWHKPNSWEFLINRKYHVIWCNVFKAASSSWMFNFNVLAGFSPRFLHETKEVYLHLARTRYPRATLEQLKQAQNDSITFIIARHPFERLLSAYQDKIVHAAPNSLHERLGRKIVRAFRKKGYILNAPLYPTFPEFVHWLLAEIKRSKSIDMHLEATTKFCTPCLIHFDVIMKFETLEQDQLYLIDKAGLKRYIMPEWRNMAKGKNTIDLLHYSYSQLTRRQMDGLYDYYQYDFDIFDYSVASYFNIIKTDEATDVLDVYMPNPI